MNEITIVRGDTLQLSIDSIKNTDGIDYVLSDTDVVYLDVKKNDYDTEAVFSKSVTAEDYADGKLPIIILPSDTKDLPYGNYCFDVRLFIDEDNIYTIIPKSVFKIVKNVTDIPEGGA